MQNGLKFTPDSLSGCWQIFRLIILSPLKIFENTPARDSVDLSVFDLPDSLLVLTGQVILTKLEQNPRDELVYLKYQEYLTHFNRPIKASQSYIYRVTPNHLFIDFPDDRFNNSQSIVSESIPSMVKPDIQSQLPSSNRLFCDFNLSQFKTLSGIQANQHLCGQDTYDMTLNNQLTEELSLILLPLIQHYQAINSEVLTLEKRNQLDEYMQLIRLLEQQTPYNHFVNTVKVSGPFKQYESVSIFYKTP